LLYSSRSQDDVIYRDELEVLNAAQNLKAQRQGDRHRSRR
jgi:hypothetical protein